MNHNVYIQYLRNNERLSRQAPPPPRTGVDVSISSAEYEQIIKLLPTVSTLMTEMGNAATAAKDDTMMLAYGINAGIGYLKSYHSAVNEVIKDYTYLEEVNQTLNKNFGLSSESAQKFAGNLRDIGIQLGYGDEKIFSYASGLKELTGGMIASNAVFDVTNKQIGGITDAFRENLVAFQAFAQGNLGVAEDAAQGYEMYARDIGVSGAAAAVALQEMTEKMSEKTGINSLQLQKTIIEEIGRLSEDARISYSRIPGSLEVAVLKAKALGFTMEQLNNAGSELMNIESSVGKELEYQLLTGRRLTTEGGKSLTNEFRMAKLRGDANKQAELMNEFIEKEGDTLRSNYLAREQAAQLFRNDCCIEAFSRWREGNN